jgi:putative transposase
MYYTKKPTPEEDILIMNEMRDIHLQWPFYGYRKMTVILRQKGYFVNHKKTKRLMRLAGLKSIYPHKKTTMRNKEHKVYPYLLKDISIVRPNQAWGVDITYIKIRGGFIYLVCLIDLFSRKIMGWAVSIFLDTKVCMDAFENALLEAQPEIINSDQGCQFTSEFWTTKLHQANIQISMDGKGRWVDNVLIERFWRTIKYEAIHLHSFDTVEQAKQAIERFIKFYNEERPHQALRYKTPNQVYKENILQHTENNFEQLPFAADLCDLSNQLLIGGLM